MPPPRALNRGKDAELPTRGSADRTVETLRPRRVNQGNYQPRKREQRKQKGNRRALWVPFSPVKNRVPTFALLAVVMFAVLLPTLLALPVLPPTMSTSVLNNATTNAWDSRARHLQV